MNHNRTFHTFETSSSLSLIIIQKNKRSSDFTSKSSIVLTYHVGIVLRLAFLFLKGNLKTIILQFQCKNTFLEIGYQLGIANVKVTIYGISSES